MTGNELKFCVLGPVRAWRGGAELNLGGPQQRGILAALLLSEGRQLRQEQLLSALWDGELPRTADATLRTYISRLRKLLRDNPGRDNGPLVRVASGYTLEVPSGSLDLERFYQHARGAATARKEGEPERAVRLLRDALDLWQGSPLAGIPGQWAESQRVWLDDLRLAALGDRLALDIDLGNHVVAAAELQELTQAYPLRERFTELLMLALYRSARQSDALAVFDAARRLLNEELGIDPGPGLRRMQERILRTDKSLIAAVSEQPPPRSVSPAIKPAQLPLDLPAFAGRENELARLDQVVKDNGQRQAVTILAIHGMGGIGKTTLALHWAHRVAGQYPDGQLYVNLRGFDPGGAAMSPGEALRGFLSVLGVGPQEVPDHQDAQAGLYRSILHGRRVLVMLDNARDVEQVRPLLPATPGCVAVVTSRGPLTSLVTMHDARPLALEPLSPDQAWQALARRLREDRLEAAPAAAEAIIEQCAGLPLALVIVAARAAAYHDLPLTVIAHELRIAPTVLSALSVPDQTTDIRKVFSWSYRQLSGPARVLFRQLSVHPGPDFSVGAVASLAGLPPAGAAPLLHELAAACLITEQHPGRYALHDLVRAYAAELYADHDSEQDRTAAVTRLADHYLHSAHSIEALGVTFKPADLPSPQPGVTPESLADHPSAMEWFTAEEGVLKNLISACAADRGLRPYAWQLVMRVQNYFLVRGLWHDWLAATQAALGAAEAEGDLPAQAYTRRSRAGAYSYLGRLDDALAELERARDLFDALGYTDERALLHANFGSVYTRNGSYREALDHARNSYDLQKALGNLRGMVTSCEILGDSLDALGRYGEAVSQYEQAIALCREINDVIGEAYSWCGLGKVRQHTGEFGLSADSYRRCIEMSRPVGYREKHAEGLVGLGDAMLALGDPHAARDAWEEALPILVDLDFTSALTAESVAAKLKELTE